MSFIHEQNIARFLRLLETETDSGKRSMIERLLNEERIKAAEPANPYPAPVSRG